MKRQKIKRYQYSVAPNIRRKPAPFRRTMGIVLFTLCLLTVAALGSCYVIQSRAVGWQGEGLHRYFVSPTTRERVYGLYEINHELYYFGNSGFARVGWIRESGYLGYADPEGKIARGETKVEEDYYYFQPETGQLYTGWVTIDGAVYCFDETGHPRTGLYMEDGILWELEDDGRVKARVNGWKEESGVLKYYDETGALAQGQMQIDGKSYLFLDGISQAGWIQTDAGMRYLDGRGGFMTDWCVIDGQPCAFGPDGSLRQEWDHSHGKNYYFVDGISKAGVFWDGVQSSELNGSGSIQPVEAEEPAEGSEEQPAEDPAAAPGEKLPDAGPAEPPAAGTEIPAEPTVPVQEQPTEEGEDL